MNIYEEGVYVTNGISPGVFTVDVCRHDLTSVICVESVDEVADTVVKDDRFYVIDENVYMLFPEISRIDPKRVFIVGSGEANKSWQSLSSLLDKLILSNTSRKGMIVGIGGGVVTDMSGLAGNLYFRGIKVCLVPTTLLAMVDASIGGKVAVNHPHQKNILGSFYHPAEVIVCTEFLNTLSDRDMSNGMGEVVKLSILSNTRLFETLRDIPINWRQDKAFLETVILTCIKEKLRLLGENCFERDLKRPLNLGHSVAHPIEDITHFRTLHGEAVGYGIVIASSISKQRGFLTPEDYRKIVGVLRNLDVLEHITEFDPDLLWQRIRRLVAQRGGQGLLYVLPTGIGECEIIQDIDENEFRIAVDEAAEVLGACRRGRDAFLPRAG